MNYFGNVEIDNMINKARIEIMIDILSEKLREWYPKETISYWVHKGSNVNIEIFSEFYKEFIPCSDCPLYEMCMHNLPFHKCDEVVRLYIMNYRANKTLEELNNENT